MVNKLTVLITGVAGYWGEKIATRLLKEKSLRIIGIDTNHPQYPTTGLTFIQTNLRSPNLTAILRRQTVNTVCHVDFTPSIHPTKNISDKNVLGTAALLEACANSNVSKVVIKSSTTVYGAAPTNPAFLSEDHPLQSRAHYGTARDLLQIEALCKNHQAQFARPKLTILRFAHIIGPTANTPLGRLLDMRYPPTLLGFNPLIQFIHEDDVAGALIHAIITDVTGTFNVALNTPMPLTQIIGAVGKIHVPVPHPLAYVGATFLQRNRPQLTDQFPIEPDYLRYRLVSDVTKMQTALNFEPEYSAAETLRAFVEQTYYRRLSPADARRIKEIKRLQQMARE